MYMDCIMHVTVLVVLVVGAFDSATVVPVHLVLPSVCSAHSLAGVFSKRKLVQDLCVVYSWQMIVVH